MKWIDFALAVADRCVLLFISGNHKHELLHCLSKILFHERFSDLIGGLYIVSHCLSLSVVALDCIERVADILTHPFTHIAF